MKRISLFFSAVVLAFASCKQSSEKETTSLPLPQNKSVTTINISDNPAVRSVLF